MLKLLFLVLLLEILLFLMITKKTIQRRFINAYELRNKLKSLRERLLDLELNNKCQTCELNKDGSDECETQLEIKKLHKQINDNIAKLNKLYENRSLRLFCYLTNIEIPEIEPERRSQYEQH